MKIQVGKKYKNRIGAIVTIRGVVSENESEYSLGWRFRSTTEALYTASGGYWSDGDKSSGDLVSEVKERKPHNLRNFVTLRVGHTYMTRKGAAVTINSKLGTDTTAYSHRYRFKSDLGNYDEKGNYLPGDRQSGFDIVAEIKLTKKKAKKVTPKPVKTVTPEIKLGNWYRLKRNSVLWGKGLLTRVINTTHTYIENGELKETHETSYQLEFGIGIKEIVTAEELAPAPIAVNWAEAPHWANSLAWNSDEDCIAQWVWSTRRTPNCEASQEVFKPESSTWNPPYDREVTHYRNKE